MLTFTDIELRRGQQILLQHCSITVHRGNRVGITGANGTGKSTLFALILGQISAESGEFDCPRGIQTAHVEQHTPSTERSAVEYTIDGDAELRELQQQLSNAEQQGNGERQATLLAEIERVDGYTAESRAATLLAGLGFLPEQIRQPVNSFSGGWRMRLNLARALMCRSDLLLLDEPTNHLDLDAVIWLEGWLSRAHINSYVTRFRAKATKARQAQSRLKTLQRLELIAPAHVDSPFKFSFKAADKLPQPLLRMKKAAIGYGDTNILQSVSVDIHRDARIGLLGPNGAGKSTLIKALAGELAASDGEIQFARETRIAYFAQHQLEQLESQQTVIQHLLKLNPAASESDLRNFLGGFGFHGDRVNEKVEPFSGGEKARLVLAMLVYQRPNLLLLDEPSNHLDMQMRHALSVALQDFAGGIVMISHDRHLLKLCCDELLLVDRGRVNDFVEDIDTYPRWLQQRNKEPAAGEVSNTVQTSGDESKRQNDKDRKRRQAELRQQLAPLRNEIRQLERQLERHQQKKAELDEKLADAELYTDDKKDELKELLWDQAKLVKAIEETEEEWLARSEQLESASAG